MSTQQTPLAELTAAFQVFASGMSEQMAKVAQAMQAGMSAWRDTPEGRYVMAVVDYYDRHPGLLDQMIAAREAETAHSCHCLCQRWDHLGSCVGVATTDRLMSGPLVASTTVPMCAPCAESVDQARART